MTNEFRPTRITEVVEQPVEDEIVVYRLETDDVHLLNSTTTAVWRHCDGASTVNELAVLASSDLGKPVDADVVLAALDELDRAGLPVDHVDASGGLSRRQLMKRVAIAAVALPIVTSIAAPTAAAAASNCAAATQPCNTQIGPLCCPGLQCNEGRCE